MRSMVEGRTALEAPPPACSRSPSPPLRGREEKYLPIRLGLRMVRGLANDHAARILAAREERPFDSVEDVWRRSGQRVPSLNELEAARADAGRARQQEAAARASLEAARLRIDEGGARLKAAVVRSPIDGYIVSRHVEPGSLVREGTPLFVLASVHDRMTIAVPLAKAQASTMPRAMRSPS